MRNRLRGFSSAFPGGGAGVGLLLLRAAVGVAAVIQAGDYIADDNPTLARWVIGLIAIASGASLLVGFLTSVAGALAGVVAIFVAVSSIPPRTPNMLDAVRPTAFVVVVAAAVVCLGPGALSLDARRFGRREIIIPRTSPQAKP